ncbi:MAG: adenosylmethionine--8-amino-7-oxononanoate transaminase [Planctomycetaceae bacterium]|nr:adenosylmethionine--8-amino-7-oxononanoate transaminase [Planctomycetaceae bacterium]|tara:strand:+ start:736 stop:2097 length:1362 start_codon:yes stop_codon:yes gene_type:complete
MTTAHDELHAWDRQHVWHAFTQMAEYTPFIVERAHGCTLFDTHDQPYLDGVSSLWCNVHGHNHPRINQAIRDQLDQVSHVTSLGASNPTTIRLARRLVERSPAELQHVFFASDGAAAVEVALKIAFQYWQQRTDPKPEKTRYLAFQQAYHGDTLGSVSVGGVDRFHNMFRPLLFDVVRAPIPDRHHLPKGVTPQSANDFYLQELEALLKTHHQQLAAVVIEPLIQAAAGMVFHPEGFYREVRNLTRRFDVLLIADEVAVGWGKTGTLFASEQEQVCPDLLCLGKGLAGGYLPLSATLATTPLWEAFLGSHADSRTFYHGHTFSGNPLAAAAALATLDVFDEEETLRHIPEKARLLSDYLAPLASHPHVGDIRQRGLITAIELVRDREQGEPFVWSERRGQRVCDFALSRGVWLRPLGDVVVVMPPLAIQPDELQQIADAVRDGIDHATSCLTD